MTGKTNPAHAADVNAGPGKERLTKQSNNTRSLFPQIGAIVVRGSFLYWVLDQSEDKAPDGSDLLKVAGQCSSCGELFTFTVRESKFQSKYQQRRCKKHARPGKPARPWHEQAKR